MPTYFHNKDTSNGTFFGSYAVTDGSPVVNSPPGNQSGVYNVAQDVDVGAGVVGALSYGIVPAITGLTVSDLGVVSYDGSLADPVNLSVVVLAYEGVGQSGASTPIAYTHRLNLPVLATLFYQGYGHATAPGGTLKQDGDIDGDGTGLDTWEITSMAAGVVVEALPGGFLEGTVPDAEGSYVIAWRYWDGTVLTTGFATEVVSDAAVTIVSVSAVRNNSAFEVALSGATDITGATINNIPQGPITRIDANTWSITVVRDNGLGTALEAGQTYRLILTTSV